MGFSDLERLFALSLRTFAFYSEAALAFDGKGFCAQFENVCVLCWSGFGVRICMDITPRSKFK
jgi:hypothetical protein